MITKNEEKTIKLIYSKPDVSLRGIVSELSLGGVSSATYIVNSLEKKGYLTKIGSATNKKYQLTDKSRAFFEVSIDVGNKYSLPLETVSTFSTTTSLVDAKSADSRDVEKFNIFSQENFGDGSNNIINTGAKTIFSAFSRILDTSNGKERYGAPVVCSMLGIFIFIVCFVSLKDKWFEAFLPLVVVILIGSLILNKK